MVKIRREDPLEIGGKERIVFRFSLMDPSLSEVHP
jgi:hypothetical protein